ncbi:LysR substrate-binding domain-containing protein [Dyella sedimenti]|uniref:LysR substrate-binding domain-containing protein n=1 Tax=Dyella sedimenti TaxID=2919947 RepID=UPI001FAAFD27|nr:LysR substrate-binding domain-containing protein [Dyella sedimenti]
MRDLNDLYYFVQVVEQGTFTAASKALGIAKSQLSSRIARLEENLGVRLIQRTTRRSHITDVGRLYYAECLQVLAAAQHAESVIEEARATPRGRIHVGCPVLFGQLLMAPVLADYLKQYPEVQVDLGICGHQADVLAGGFDIAFRVRQSVKDSSLVVRSFGMDPHILVASPALLQGMPPPQQPADLQHLPSIDVVQDDGRHFWTLTDRQGHTETIEHHPRLVTDDLHVLLRAVASGVGVAQLPQWLCRSALARGELVRLLGTHALPPGNVHSVYASRHGHTPALRSFIEFVAKELPRTLLSLQRSSYAYAPEPMAQAM